MPDLASKPVRRVETRDMSFERLLDSDEAAALLKIHPKTLQKMARNGRYHGCADRKTMALSRLGPERLA